MRLLPYFEYLIRNIKASAMKFSNNTSLTAAASIAGLAIGAALGILFAPKSGRDIRSKLKFSTAGHRYQEDDLLTDHQVQDLWETTRDHADHLQGPEGKRKNPSRIEVPSAGTLAWTAHQKNESKQPWKENNSAEWRF